MSLENVTLADEGVDRGNGVLVEGFKGMKPHPKMHFSADSTKQKGDLVELTGNAKVTFENKVITGDKIFLNLKSGTAKASGKAEYKAERIKIDFFEDSSWK